MSLRIVNKRDRFGAYQVVMDRITGTWGDAVAKAQDWERQFAQYQLWKLEIAKDPKPGRRYRVEVWFRVGE